MTAPTFNPPGRDVLKDPPEVGSRVLVWLPNAARDDGTFQSWLRTGPMADRAMERWLRDAGGDDAQGLWWPLPDRVE